MRNRADDPPPRIEVAYEWCRERRRVTLGAHGGFGIIAAVLIIIGFAVLIVGP